MNTTPDEVLLALWLDDELQGEELARMEAWALTQPEQLAAREEVRNWRQSIGAVVPAEVEPPYPDFFNSRIEKAIRESSREESGTVVPAAVKVSLWRSWFLPATAFAGMALAFWVGTKAHRSPATLPPVAKADAAGPMAPIFYTPEQGVDAVWVHGSRDSSSVIVLQGVSAIPDALDFTETALYQQNPGSQNSTAGTLNGEPAKSTR